MPGAPITLTRRELLAGVAAISAASILPTPLIAQSPLLASDPRRPQFHLLPAHNWMNDPNGPIYFNGQYHMFFQFNPGGATWGNMSWNHAVSHDMMHWAHLPLAIEPTPNSPDAYGCFSGSAIAVGKRVYFVYTGTIKSTSAPTIKADNIQESQCLAWSDDPSLVRWTKQPTPIVPAPPVTLDITGFRDPSAWRHGDWYYMTVGSGIANVGGCVLLYRSRDMHQWEYLHPLTSGQMTGHPTPNPCDDGEMWECPDFFPLEGSTLATHLLIYSTQGKVFWQSGTLDPVTMLFHPLKTGLLDAPIPGNAFYAPKTQLDAHGRRILWGWIQERRSEPDMRAAGWSGLMSLPRVLTLNSDGSLKMRFLPELKALRHSSISQGVARSGTSRTLANATGELLYRPPTDAADFNFKLSMLPNGAALCEATYAKDSKSFTIDNQNFPLEPGDRPSLHAYIDGSVLELILAERYSCTRRFYCPGETAPDLLATLTTFGKSSMEGWTISPISTNRLTTPAANRS